LQHFDFIFLLRKTPLFGTGVDGVASAVFHDTPIILVRLPEQ